jgi:hypothetical protein
VSISSWMVISAVESAIYGVALSWQCTPYE